MRNSIKIYCFLILSTGLFADNTLEQIEQHLRQISKNTIPLGLITAGVTAHYFLSNSDFCAEQRLCVLAVMPVVPGLCLLAKSAYLELTK
jgi:hypothetical protein